MTGKRYRYNWNLSTLSEDRQIESRHAVAACALNDMFRPSTAGPRVIKTLMPSNDLEQV